jgi:hypothetical protein
VGVKPRPELRAKEVLLEGSDDPNKLPSLPPLADDDELVSEVDAKTGEMLS